MELELSYSYVLVDIVIYKRKVPVDEHADDWYGKQHFGNVSRKGNNLEPTKECRSGTRALISLWGTE